MGRAHRAPRGAFRGRRPPPPTPRGQGAGFLRSLPCRARSPCRARDRSTICRRGSRRDSRTIRHLRRAPSRRRISWWWGDPPRTLRWDTPRRPVDTPPPPESVPPPVRILRARPLGRERIRSSSPQWTPANQPGRASGWSALRPLRATGCSGAPLAPPVPLRRPEVQRRLGWRRRHSCSPASPRKRTGKTEGERAPIEE